MTARPKIPVFKTVAEAYKVSFGHPKALLMGLSLPLLIIIIFFQTPYYRLFEYFGIYNSIFSFIFQHIIELQTILVLLFLSLFFAYWQSAILFALGGTAKRSLGAVCKTYPLMVTWLICAIALSVTPIVFGLIFLPLISMPSPSPFLFIASLLLWVIVSAWLLLRTILVFPEVAATDKIGLLSAWRLSKGNGWRLGMVMLLAVLPPTLLIRGFDHFVLRQLSFVGQSVGGGIFIWNSTALFLTVAVLKFAGFVVGIAALSVAYRRLKGLPAQPTVP